MPPADPPPRASPVAWGGIVRALLVAALLAVCWSIVSDPVLQWDFRLLYASAKAWAHGDNPYDPAVLAPVLHDPTIAYSYPPDTLGIFRVFNALDAGAASRVYLLLQLGLVAALYACWQRFFLAREDRDSPWFAAFCFFGLGGALTIDLRAGNISLLEQTLLWLGLAAYLRGRKGWFCVLLWLAASFKLTLLAFSGLLLVEPPRQWGKFACLWAAMAGRLALDYLFSPALLLGFVHGLTRMSTNPQEGGKNNPSMPEFLKDLMRFSLGADDEGLVRIVATVLYALVAVAVLALTWRAWRAINRRWPGAEGNVDGERGVLLVCLYAAAYGLLIPRLKDYSCILLLLPVWRLAKFSLAGKRDAWLALIAAACLSNFSAWFGVYAAYVFLWRYQALAVTFAAWALFVHETLTLSPPPDAGEISPPAA